MRKEQISINTLYYNGQTYTDSEGKANALNNQFVSVFTNEDQFPLPYIPNEPTPDIAQITINVEGVFNLLTKIEPNKAAGPDGIPPRLLKEMAYQMAPLLTFIFQSSLDQGQLPQDWKSANITPIYKKGNRTDPANYRPISLTSTCSKILEHIIYSFVSTHLSNYNILSTNQHGFRTGRSCDTQLLGAINDFHHSLDSGTHIDALFLDFTKAFDKVSHRKLCYKLLRYGVNGNLLHWIKDYLTDRTQCVLLEGISSKSHHVLSGVPQGSVLAPLLFLIYIKDITESITSTIRLYADDVLLYRVISNEADTICLQNDLFTLENWANTWQIKFNPSKCIHVAITRKKTSIKHCYQIHSQQIQQSNSAKYLGVVIDQHLTWKEHVNNICSKAIKAKAFLQRNLHQCPASVKSNCYTSLVRPILEYAAVVWSPHLQCQKNQIEKIQRSAARFVTNDFSYHSSVTSMLTHLKWPSLEQRRNFLKLIMFYKILNDLVDVSITLAPLSTSTRGHNQRFVVPFARTDTYLNSFLPSTIKLWNSLPDSLIELDDINQFKEDLSLHLFPTD